MDFLTIISLLAILTVVFFSLRMIVTFINKKLKVGHVEINRGKLELSYGEYQYKKYNNWFIRVFAADKLDNGYRKILKGKEDLKKGTSAIKRWTTISSTISFFSVLTGFALFLLIFYYLSNTFIF